MNPTSFSLLDRLKVAGPEASDWNRLQGIYLPLIERWLGRVPGLGDESADLAQEVLVVVFREVPRFERQREGSFRAWLRKVTVNKILNYRRQRHRRPAVGLDPADGFLERLSDANGDLAREWDREHDKHVVEKLLAVVQADFTSGMGRRDRSFSPARADGAARPGRSVTVSFSSGANTGLGPTLPVRSAGQMTRSVRGSTSGFTAARAATGTPRTTRRRMGSGFEWLRSPSSP